MKPAKPRCQTCRKVIAPNVLQDPRDHRTRVECLACFSRRLLTFALRRQREILSTLSKA